MNMKFDWEKFTDTNNKVAVLCKTQDEANDFCKRMDEHGMKWGCGISYLDGTSWEIYTEDTAYTNYGTYSPIEYYRKQKDYTILEWSDYMDFTKSDMLNGYVCELRNGKIGIWINGTVNDSNFINYIYRKDLTYEYTDKNDIIKVSDCYGKIIWERVEEVVDDLNKKEWEFVDECKTTFTIAPNNNYGYIRETNEPIMFDLESNFDKRVAVGLSISQAKQIVSALTEIVEFVESEK